MTNKIKLITAPDLVFDQAPSILVIAPNDDLKKSVEDFIADKTKSLNLYFYFGAEQDLKWLLTVSKLSDTVLIDLDHCSEDLNKIIGYIISMPNTYYRTADDRFDWSLLNSNRFYDFPTLKGY